MRWWILNSYTKMSSLSAMWLSISWAANTLWNRWLYTSATTSCNASNLANQHLPISSPPPQTQLIVGETTRFNLYAINQSQPHNMIVQSSHNPLQPHNMIVQSSHNQSQPHNMIVQSSHNQSQPHNMIVQSSHNQSQSHNMIVSAPTSGNKTKKNFMRFIRQIDSTNRKWK